MASFVLLVFLFVLTTFVLFNLTNKIVRHYRLRNAIEKIPGPSTHWLWGNLHQIEMTQAYALKMYQWRTENNIHLNRYWNGPFDPVVYLTHPRHIKQLLNEPKADIAYSMLEPWLGPGLLIANGKKWSRSRRLLTPAFHFDILKPYVHVYNECTDQLLAKWQKSADKGIPVNVCESVRKLTLDVLLQCACSYNSDCQKEGCEDPYVLAVEDLVVLSTDRFFSLLSQSNEVFYKYFTPQGWTYRKALRKAHKQSEMVIAKRKAALREMDEKYYTKNTTEILTLAQSRKKHLDFLDILLASQDEDGIGLTDLEVRNEVDTFMFEGHDTTANALTFTLYLLALHPKHQEKCREEVKDVLRGRDKFDYEDLSKLQYTTWCIKESMRRYPPVFNIYRRVTQDAVEIDGYLVPKGIWAAIDIAGIHWNTDVWENPFEFDPLRFHPDNVKARQPFSYIPFSAGPRNCIGQNFALDELRVVIGSLLNRFNLTLLSDEPVEVLPKVVLRPVKEVQLYLIPLATE